MFVPKDESYIKMQVSDFLAQETFTKIIAFKRFMDYDYILTDEFLLQAENPFAKQG